MRYSYGTVNTENAYLFVVDRIRPKSAVVSLFLIGHGRQCRHITVERDAQPSARSVQRLKYSCGGMALPPEGADEYGAFGFQIAELDAAAGVDRDCVFIEWVLGLRAQLDWLTGAAHLQLEEAGRPLRVRVSDADDREGLRPHNPPQSDKPVRAFSSQIAHVGPAMTRGAPLLRSALAAVPLVVAAAIGFNAIERTSPALGMVAAIALLIGLLIFLYLAGTRTE